MSRHSPAGSVSLWFPGPLFTINAERSMNHFKRADLVKTFRDIAMITTKNEMRRGAVSKFTVPVHVEFFPHQAKAGKIADTANHLPPAKACLDGVVDAGLLTDDTPEFVLSQRFWPPVKGMGVGITLLIHPESVTL